MVVLTKVRKTLKIYTVGEDKDLKLAANLYAGWINNGDIEAAENMEDSDIVIFTGGLDVNPSLYGETPHSKTIWDRKRDEYELAEFRKAIQLNKFILGICRGAQLSCVMAGGKLIQHVDPYHSAGHHIIFDRKTNDIYSMTTSHHQMMMPYSLKEDEYSIIAYASTKDPRRGTPLFYSQGNHRTYLNNILLDNYNNFMEPEIVWFPKIKAFAIQGHPEWMIPSTDAKTIRYMNSELINKLVTVTPLKKDSIQVI